jgi:hypothetical protein
MSEELSAEAALLAHLPGGDLIVQGLADARAGLETVNALLVEIAAPRLRRSGLNVPKFPAQAVDAEIRLYRLLGREFGCDAYGQYNSLLRRLSSLNRALEAAARRVQERARSP